MPPSGSRRVQLSLFLLGIIAGAGLPLLTVDSYYLDIATKILMTLLLTLSLQMQMSTGQVNMAHISFMGIGAYTVAVLTLHHGQSFWLSIWVAAGFASVVSVPVGLLALRLSGPYFFLITFAFSEVVRTIFNNFFVDTFGGTSGLVGIPVPDPLHASGLTLTFSTKVELYWLMLVLFAMFGVIPFLVETTRYSLLSDGIRQQPVLVETLGTRVIAHRLISFVVGSFIAAIAGVFFVVSHRVVHADDFSLAPMVLLVAYVVVGGTRSVWGALLGTVVLSVATEYMRDLREYQSLVFGAVLVLFMLIFPGGLISLPGLIMRTFAPISPQEPDRGSAGAGIAA